MKKEKEVERMDTRVALIGIIVEDTQNIEKLNAILHEYAPYIIGRMGVPHARCGISVISIVLDAPNDVISALSGKIGMLPHISAKTIYSKVTEPSSEKKGGNG